MSTYNVDIRHPMAQTRMVRREKYAWPGGYAMALVTTDGGILCADCVQSEFSQISSAYRSNDRRSGWHPAGMTHTGEMDDFCMCDHCGAVIFDPDAND